MLNFTYAFHNCDEVQEFMLEPIYLTFHNGYIMLDLAMQKKLKHCGIFGSSHATYHKKILEVFMLRNAPFKT